MLKNKIHIPSFNMKNFIQIALILILSVISLNQCITNKENKQKLKLNKESAKDTIEYYKNKHGLLVAEKKAFQTTIKEMDVLIDDYLHDNEQLQETIKSFKKPTSAHSSDIEINTDVDIKFANPIPFNFEREFKKVTNNYAVSGVVNQYGFDFNFFAATQFTLGTGIKKTGLFSSDFTSEATLSNSDFTITNMDNINFIEKQSRFSVGVFGGYVLTSELKPTFAVGFGVSYNIIRF